MPFQIHASEVVIPGQKYQRLQNQDGEFGFPPWNLRNRPNIGKREVDAGSYLWHFLSPLEAIIGIFHMSDLPSFQRAVLLVSSHTPIGLDLSEFSCIQRTCVLSHLCPGLTRDLDLGMELSPASLTSPLYSACLGSY